MKQLKWLFCLFLLTVTAFGCGDDEVPPTPATTCKLTSYTNESTANITYEGDKISKIAILGEGYITFEYNSAGKVVKMNDYTDTNELIAYTTLNHVSNALITSQEYEKNASGAFVLQPNSLSFQFDGAGNLTKIVDGNSYTRYTYNAQNNATAEYKKEPNKPEYKERGFANYDDKKNVASENFIFMALEIGFPVYGVNNPKQIIAYDTDGTIDEITDLAYQYNEQGYVKKIYDPTGANSGEILYGYSCP
jgi:YD repeat-containing protein